MGKKSYNPFKMWGSYVGLVIGMIIAHIGMDKTAGIFNYTSDFEALWFIPVGFLIGWGIHSLIRTVRK